MSNFSNLIVDIDENSLIERIQWCLTHGIVMATKKTNNNNNEISMSMSSLASMQTVQHAPITYNPYKFPLNSFEKAKNLSRIFNKVIDRISRNSSWLMKTLKSTGAGDPFTGKLLDIYDIIHKEGIKQKVALGLLRSDYMLHDRNNDPRTFLQVEINTIASSFGSLSTKISEMHKAFEVDRNIPDNIALDELCDGLAAAHFEYIRQIKQLQIFNEKHVNLHIVMIIQPGETNFADQRLLHLQLVKKYNNSIKLKRITLLDMYTRGSIDESNGELFYDGNPISVVYFRAGYTPDDYPSNNEWDARITIERSFAIKCPNLGYHLAGTKKVQEVISTKEVLIDFVDSSEDLSALMECFAGLYNLDIINQSESTIKEVENTKKMALNSPSSFVMKPQREGGGNNLYGSDIVDALNSMNDQEIAAYIIMERIQPPSQNAILIRNGTIFETSCHCELGIYGIFLGDGSNESYSGINTDYWKNNPNLTNTININKYGGYLLRVKPNTSNEGGVAAGYAVLSSIDLDN